MKIKKLAAGLLAALLFALVPAGALAQESVLENVYEGHVRSAVERLQAMPVPEIDEEALPFDPAPQLDDAGEDGMEDDMERIEAEEFDAAFEEEMQQLEQQLYDAVQDADGTMYSQLNERQRNCYDALAGVSIDRILTAARDKNGRRQVKLTITGIQGVTITGRVVGGSLSPDTAGAQVRKSLFTDLRLAIVALRYDRPDMIWLGDMSYGYSSQRMTSSSVRVTTANYSFELEFNENEREMRDFMLSCADVVVEEARSLPDRYLQVMLVHDVLALGSTYNHAAADKQITGIPYEMAHCAYSALVINDNYEPVCDGYSEAMKIILDRMGIPCVTATSLTHMWNNIKMDDGRWYNVDVTWDDDDQEPVCHDYFLIGSQTRVDGQAFCKQSSHVEENPFKPNTNTNAFTLYFPTKRESSYEYLGHDYEPLRFADVGRDEWYYDYVEQAAVAGLMQGNENGRFNPGANISRAEFAQVIANMVHAQLGNYSGSPFSDVPAGAWYAPAVSWIKEYGLMQGSNGQFRPTEGIAKQEMCVVLYNLAKVQKLDLTSSSTRFSDHNSIASWAQEAVYVCKELGLVQGDANGALMPASNSMRCVAATMFVRYRDLTGDVTLPWPPPTTEPIPVPPTPTPNPTPTPPPTSTPEPSAAPAPTPKPSIDATVYWVPNGKVYHSTRSCASLHASTSIFSGTVAQAQTAGKRNPCKVCH